MPLPIGGIRYFRKYLFDNTITQADWSRGIVRDIPRSSIPDGGSYDLIDFFVDRPGMLYKRGGTSYLNTAISAQVAIVAVAAPAYPGDPRVIAIGTDGASTRTLYDVTTGTAASGIDVHSAQPTENLKLDIDKLILTSGTVFYAPQKVYLSTGTVTVASLGGSPPVAIVSCLHAGRLLLAHTSANPNRIYFSPDGGIESAWDTTNSWIDVDEPIMGLASIAGVLIVFSRGNCYRILGDIPPAHVDSNGTPDTNMTLQPLGAVGCIDARTIVEMDNEVYFANETGVYKTNGSGFVCLTNKPDSTGISSLWQSTLQNFSPALGAVVCCGTYQNQFLTVSVRHNNGTQSQFVYYTQNQSWVKTSVSTNALMYATGFAPTNEIYAGTITDSRVLKLSGMWSPASGNKNDATGSAVAPVWEAKPFSDAVGLKRYGFAHVTYDMRDASSDNPTLATTIATGIEADSSYAAVRESPLAETTQAIRKRFTINKDSQGVSFKFTQSNASSKTEIYYLENEVAPYFVADGQ